MGARANRIAIAILVSSLSVLICLAIGEVGLRAMKPRFFDSLQYEYEPVLGWTNRPGAVYYNVLGDGKPVRIDFNSSGFRDLDHSKDKPPYTRRIVVIGDSFSEAAQVNLDETYWRQLAATLNAGSNLRWEVMNFGVGDYGTTQAYLTLLRGLRYRPDLILLQVAPINDICNNSMAAVFLCSPQDRYRPYFDPAREYKTIRYLDPVQAWLRAHLFLFRVGERAVRGAAQRLLGPSAGDPTSQWHAHVTRKLSALRWPMEFGFAPIVLNTFAPDEHQTPFIRDGWAVTERAIERIHETAASRQIPMIVLVVPSEWQLYPYHGRVAKGLPFPVDRHYAEKRLAAFLGPRGVPVIPLLDLMEENSADGPPYVLGHFDVSAHGIVARALLPVVRRALPEVPAYRVGERLSFSRHSNGVPFLAYGFSTPDKHAAWTAHQRAVLRLTLLPPVRPLSLNVHAVAFAPTQLGPDQFVDVVFNGTTIARWTLTGRAGIETYRARIDPALVPDHGPSELTLRFSERRSPQELGINDDYRRLGLGLVDMSLVEE